MGPSGEEMTDVKRCPICGGELTESLHSVTGGWSAVWTCPNEANHGQTVKCSNCGEQVKHPREHWHSVKGVYGSGKWMCFPPIPPTCWEPALEQPIYPPDPPGVTSIRMGGYVVCSKRLPCPDHSDLEEPK